MTEKDVKEFEKTYTENVFSRFSNDAINRGKILLDKLVANIIRKGEIFSDFLANISDYPDMGIGMALDTYADTYNKGKLEWALVTFLDFIDNEKELLRWEQALEKCETLS